MATESIQFTHISWGWNELANSPARCRVSVSVWNLVGHHTVWSLRQKLVLFPQETVSLRFSVQICQLFVAMWLPGEVVSSPWLYYTFTLAEWFWLGEAYWVNNIWLRCISCDSLVVILGTSGRDATRKTSKMEIILMTSTVCVSATGPQQSNQKSLRQQYHVSKYICLLAHIGSCFWNSIYT